MSKQEDQKSKSQLRIVLVAPRIAANVGSIARTCSALGAELHLVRPFGFFLNEKEIRRASVGYWQDLQPVIYRDFEHFWKEFPGGPNCQILWATKRGEAVYSEQSFSKDVLLIFGNEEEGVPKNFWEFSGLRQIVACRIPTLTVRCLNLGVSVAVIGFEVIRQWGKRLNFDQQLEGYGEA